MGTVEITSRAAAQLPALPMDFKPKSVGLLIDLRALGLLGRSPVQLQKGEQGSPGA